MVRVRKDDQIKSQCTHVNEYHCNGDEQRPCLVDSPIYQFRHERSCVCAKTAWNQTPLAQPSNSRNSGSADAWHHQGHHHGERRGPKRVCRRASAPGIDLVMRSRTLSMAQKEIEQTATINPSPFLLVKRQEKPNLTASFRHPATTCSWFLHKAMYFQWSMSSNGDDMPLLWAWKIRSLIPGEGSWTDPNSGVYQTSVPRTGYESMDQQEHLQNGSKKIARVCKRCKK